MLKIRARSIKAAAIVAIGFLFAGMTATAASAHTGDLHASAVCQADGTYLVTYTLDIDRAAGKTGSTMWKVGTTTFTGGTPTSNFGLVLGPVTSTGNGTITLGTTTLPGDSTKAPWAYAFTTWSDTSNLVRTAATSRSTATASARSPRTRSSRATGRTVNTSVARPRSPSRVKSGPRPTSSTSRPAPGKLRPPSSPRRRRAPAR